VGFVGNVGATPILVAAKSYFAKEIYSVILFLTYTFQK